jgi:ATP-dependent Clp protease, protease subunit
VVVQQALRQLEQFERWYRKPNGDFDSKRIKQKPLQIKIDSPGGTVPSSMGLLDKLDALKEAGVIVETVVQGMGASMGAVFANAGSKGHRYATPNSTLMIHQVVSAYPAGGRQYVSEMGKDYQNADRMNRLIYERFKDNLNGKLSPTELKDAMRENCFLNPKEAKDIGLIDHVGFPPVKGFDEASDTKTAS